MSKKNIYLSSGALNRYPIFHNFLNDVDFRWKGCMNRKIRKTTVQEARNKNPISESLELLIAQSFSRGQFSELMIMD
jgi:hypothetical protein